MVNNPSSAFMKIKDYKNLLESELASTLNETFSLFDQESDIEKHESLKEFIGKEIRDKFIKSIEKLTNLPAEESDDFEYTPSPLVAELNKKSHVTFGELKREIEHKIDKVVDVEFENLDPKARYSHQNEVYKSLAKEAERICEDIVKQHKSLLKIK